MANSLTGQIDGMLWDQLRHQEQKYDNELDIVLWSHAIRIVKFPTANLIQNINTVVKQHIKNLFDKC